MWLTKQRATPGNVFGSTDKFEGLGVFFDTYKNNRPGTVFPYIMAMNGDGKTAYDKDTIIDFQVSSELHDIVDLRGLKSIKDYDDLFDKHLKDHGDDVWIIGGKGDTLVLKNVDFASLAEEHFII